MIPLEPDGGPDLMDQPVFAFWMLEDLCPIEVSIHFETFEHNVDQIQGDFKHFCVPEPGGIALLALGSSLLFCRRGVRR